MMHIMNGKDDAFLKTQDFIYFLLKFGKVIQNCTKLPFILQTIDMKFIRSHQYNENLTLVKFDEYNMSC